MSVAPYYLMMAREKSLNLAVLCHCASLTGCFTDEKGQIEVLSVRCKVVVTQKRQHV